MGLVFDEARIGQVIFEKLQSIDSNIYHDRAPSNVSFPFGVFNVLDAFQQENAKTSFILEIDFWSNTGNQITSLLALVNSVAEGLHKCVYRDSNIFLYFNLESQLRFPDEEKQIRRRQLRFLVQFTNRNL